MDCCYQQAWQWAAAVGGVAVVAQACPASASASGTRLPAVASSSGIQAWAWQEDSQDTRQDTQRQGRPLAEQGRPSARLAWLARGQGQVQVLAQTMTSSHRMDHHSSRLEAQAQQALVAQLQQVRQVLAQTHPPMGQPVAALVAESVHWLMMTVHQPKGQQR